MVVECGDLIAARRHAIAGIRAILASEAGQGPIDLNRYIEITDAAGAPVMRVSFCEAII